MDRFSKTTEIDTAEIAAAAMEDDTPKKSKATIIIALVLCVLVSVVVWLFVMETDTEPARMELDIGVYAAMEDDTPIENVEIIVSGLRKNIVDIKKQDLRAIKREDGQYDIYFVDTAKAEIYDLVNESTADEIIVSVKEK